MGVPPVDDDGDEADSGLDQPTGEEQAAPGLGVAERGDFRRAFALKVEGFAGACGTENAVGPVGKAAEGSDLGVLRFDPAEEGVEVLGQALALLQSPKVERIAVEGQAADGEGPVGGRLVSGAETRILRSQVARLAEGPVDGNEGRKIFGAGQLPADHRAEHGVLERRGRAVSGDEVFLSDAVVGEIVAQPRTTA